MLIVEDDDELRGLIQTALVEAGYVAVEAADGAAALVLCARHDPDVILLDLALRASAAKPSPMHTGADSVEQRSS